ncbi:MAG: hypothetical protein WC551_12025 [Patescibacteria group bacterium]
MAVADLYASKADLKVRLGIASADASQDTLLEELIEGASRSIDLDCGRVFTTASTASAKLFSGAEQEILFVPDFHSLTELVVAVDGVTWTRGATLDFTVFPASPDSGWPYTGLVAVCGEWSDAAIDNISVTAKWGWPSVPIPIKYATLARAQQAYLDLKHSPALQSEGIGSYRYSRFDPEKQELVDLRVIRSFARRIAV